MAELPDLAQPSGWVEFRNSEFVTNPALSVSCADTGPGFRFVLAADGQCAATTTTTVTTTTTLMTNGGRCSQDGECISGGCAAGRCVGSAGAGASCQTGYDCGEGVCRGGACCGPKGKA